MLRIASRSLLSRGRAFCALPEASGAEAAMIQKIESSIEEMKNAKYAGYDAADLARDLDADTVDTNKLAETFDFSDEMKKGALSLYNRGQKIRASIAAKREKNEKGIDWEKWEAELEDQDMVAALKKAHTEELGTDYAKRYLDALDAGIAKAGADFDKDWMVKGAETAKAAVAKQAEIMEELENIKFQVKNLKTLTIAEILENEPELRQQVEDEIANNNWAP